ncbi:amidohydrolase family protein [Cellulomonas sp. Y8]|uniref:amidohydrolase family protein n=1 Tax=Cellulomonas sp. Y8 TaxID=2591145 RepID=UPI003D71616E
MSTTPFALTGAAVVTCDEAGTVLPDHTVLVDATGTITEVGPTAAVPVPAGYRRLSGTGRYVLPGLINAHAHLFADGKPLPPVLTSESAEHLVSAVFHSPVGRRVVTGRARRNVDTQLRSGVTTIRSLGDVAYEVVRVRDEIEGGKRVGPRLLPSGPLLAGTGGHGTPTIALVGDDPWAARRNVRTNLRKGVGAIKIAATGGVTDARAIGEAGRPQLTEEEMTAICEEAHTAGVLVAAHAQSREGIARALRAGVDTIEHGAGMDAEIVDLFRDNPRSLRGWSALVPTLQACLPLVRLPRSDTGIDDVVHANAEMILDEMLQGIRDARAHGIALGMGTDSALTYVTHYNTWREIDLLVRYGGLTVAEALHAATTGNARVLGLEAVTGAVQAGRAADLLVVDGDPLADLRALAHPAYVVVRGAVLDHPAVERFPEIDDRLDTL